MGKNTQGHRGGSGPAQGGGDDVNPAATAAAQDGKVDGAFHSPAFLAAHIARLTSTDRVSWDDFKKKQTEDARKAALEAAQEDAATLEFRKQLDADRAKLLKRAEKEAKSSKKKRRSRSRSGERKKHRSKDGKKDGKRKHKSSKKHKRRDSDSSGSDSGDSSDSDDSADKFRLSKWRNG